MATGYLACTFSAISSAEFTGWAGTTSMPGCCFFQEGIEFGGAYGIDPSDCHVLNYGAQYVIMVLARNSGSLPLTDSDCPALEHSISATGIVVPGSGVENPLDYGPAAQYGFMGCDSASNSTSSSTVSAAVSTATVTSSVAQASSSSALSTSAAMSTSGTQTGPATATTTSVVTTTASAQSGGSSNRAIYAKGIVLAAILSGIMMF